MRRKLESYFVILLILFLASCPNSPEKSVPIKVGPDVPANLVVYFKLGTSENDVEKCYQETIYVPRPDGRGEGIREGSGRFLRLLPSQANGHEAFALDFEANSTYEQRQAIKRLIKSCTNVYKIFENIAPQEIRESQ